VAHEPRLWRVAENVLLVHAVNHGIDERVEELPRAVVVEIIREPLRPGPEAVGIDQLAGCRPRAVEVPGLACV
jgi:hypothetical protein